MNNSQNNGKNKNKGKGSNRKRYARSTVPSDPPPLNSSIQLNHTFRFQFQADSGSTPINIDTLSLFQMLVFSSTTTSVGSIIQAIRLQRVTLWGSPNNSNPGSPPTQLNWTLNQTSSIGVKPIMRGDVTLGTAIPAALSLVPTPGSSQGAWQTVFTSGSFNATSGADFSVSAGAGSVLDIKCQVILLWGNTQRRNSSRRPYRRRASLHPLFRWVVWCY